MAVKSVCMQNGFNIKEIDMWVLVLLFYAGPLSNADSVSIATQEFGSQQACIAAGKATQSLTRSTTKVVKFTCTKK